MYKIKNISNSNVNINEKIIYPQQTTKVDSIDDLGALLSIGYIEIINESEIILNKDELIEAFFNLHLFKCSNKDLSVLKNFYCKSNISNGISAEILESISSSSNQEEFLEVLLNSFYPAMIDLKIKDI